MSNCLGIVMGAAFDCENPLQAGVNERLILMNLDDIATVTEVDNVITDITLKNGKLAYAFEGTRNSLVPQYTFVQETFSVGYEHQCQFQVFDISQAQKDNTEALAKKKVVGIVENRDRNTDSTFEIYGIGVGMDTSEDTRLPGDSATGGSMTIIIKTNEDSSKESKKPQSFFDTDYATTLAKVEGLLNLPSVLNLSTLALSVGGGDSLVITGENFFLAGVSDVSSIDFIDSANSATNQAAFVVDSDSQITIASTVALAAGSYSLRVTTSAGVTQTEDIIAVS